MNWIILIGKSLEVGKDGEKEERRMEMKCKIRIMKEKMDIFGIMKVIRIKEIRSKGSKGKKGFIMEVEKIKGMGMINKGVLGEEKRRMGMEKRKVNIRREDMGKKMDIVRKIKVKKMGKKRRMDKVKKMDV